MLVSVSQRKKLRHWDGHIQGCTDWLQSPPCSPLTQAALLGMTKRGTEWLRATSEVIGPVIADLELNLWSLTLDPKLSLLPSASTCAWKSKMVKTNAYYWYKRWYWVQEVTIGPLDTYGILFGVCPFPLFLLQLSASCFGTATSSIWPSN